MSELPPNEPLARAAWMQRRRVTEIHAALGVAGVLVALIGAGAILWVSSSAGLYYAQQIPRGWIATFDYWNAVFVFMWSGVLISFGAHDGQYYHFRLRVRVRRTGYSDAAVLVGFPLVGVLWAELALRRVLSARAVDPHYLRRLPWGTPPEVLQTGIGTVMAVYYAVLGIVLILYFIGLRYNPVDLDAYGHASVRIATFGRYSRRF